MSMPRETEEAVAKLVYPSRFKGKEAIPGYTRQTAIKRSGVFIKAYRAHIQSLPPPERLAAMEELGGEELCVVVQMPPCRVSRAKTAKEAEIKCRSCEGCATWENRGWNGKAMLPKKEG
jgi:hypothetical protein